MSHYIIEKYEALDIETIWDNDIIKPLCIAITNKNKIHFKLVDIRDIDKGIIADFLLKKCSSKKIYYVHNLTFEMFTFLQEFKKKNIKFKLISANKTIYSAEIWYNKKKIKLRCSYRLTMLSLKKLAELAEVEHKTIFPYSILNKSLQKQMIINKDMFDNEEDYNQFTKEHGTLINTHKILEEYCKNDAIITKKSIIKYWNIIIENGLTNNNHILTAAKLSVTNFFKNNKFIKKKIKLKHDRLIRQAYYGGRTEVFGNPKNNEILLHYDWSGMYAQCMCEKVLGGEIIESNAIKDISDPGFYWIEFEQNLKYPILPIKKEKLLFANGNFRGWYWFEEIMLAIEHGIKIKSVGKKISAEYYDYFLKDFVLLNNKIREKGPLHKIIGKNNNNTFYGRLGMDPERLEEEIISNPNDFKKYEKIVETNNIYLGYSKKEKSISNVIISAAITAKARIKLYKGMHEVIKAGGRLLYTDTDSIIVAFNKNTYKDILNIPLGEVLFDSTKPDTIIIDGVFAMPKTYALKYENGTEITKIKGFNVTPNFEEFKKKFYNKEEIITINNEWNKKDFIIKFIKREKSTNLFGLNKRIWDKDLKNTYPLQL
jgi:hypothetical protein